MTRRRLHHKPSDYAIRCFLGLLNRLPDRSAARLGAWLGTAYARLKGPRMGDALENIRRSFPAWSHAECRRVLAKAMSRMGEGIAEFARLGSFDRAAAYERVSIEGREHLEEALATSRTGGVILLTAHFGSWELCAAAMALQGLPLSIVHREIKNPYVERIVVAWRERAGIQVLHRGSAGMSVLRALRKGRIVIMPLDQNTKRSEGIFVPFLGRPACTRSGPARLALRTGTPVVPAFMYAGTTPGHHIVRIAPALELVDDPEHPERAIYENVRRMTQSIEDAIRGAPDHWMWVHRRWKTQPLPEDLTPPGESSQAAAGVP